MSLPRFLRRSFTWTNWCRASNVTGSCARRSRTRRPIHLRRGLFGGAGDPNLEKPFKGWSDSVFQTLKGKQINDALPHPTILGPGRADRAERHPVDRPARDVSGGTRLPPNGDVVD